MVKNRVFNFTVIFLIIIFISPVSLVFSNSEYSTNYIEDNAGIFSNEDMSNVNQQLENLSNTYDIPAYILTNDESYRMSVREFANSALANRVGNDNNGILLFIDMYNSEVYITISGDTVLRTISDVRQDIILDTVAPLIRNNPLKMGLEYSRIIDRYLEEGPIKGIEIVEENSIDIKDLGIAGGAGILTTIFSYLNFKSGVTVNPEPLVYSLLGKSTSNLIGLDAKLIDSQKFYRNIPRTTSYGGMSSSSRSSRTTTHRSSGGGTFSGRGRKF